MQKMSSRESMAKGKKIGLTVYKRMLENIRDVIVVCQDGLLKYVNKRTLEMLGYDDEEELLNKDITAIIHSADAEKVLTSHRRRLGRVHRPAYRPLAVSICSPAKVRRGARLEKDVPPCIPPGRAFL